SKRDWSSDVCSSDLMAATMGYDELASLTHTLENIFDGIRDGKLTVKTETMDVLFNATDQLNAIVEDIANGGDGKRDVSLISKQLEQIEHGKPIGEVDEAAPEPNETTAADSQIHLDEFQITILEESKEKGYQTYEIEVELRA